MARPRKERGDIPADAPLPPGSKRDPARGRVKVYAEGRYIGPAYALAQAWEMWGLAMGQAEGCEQSDVTFAELAEKWAGLRNVKPRTKVLDANALKQIRVPELASDIKPSDVAAWLQAQYGRQSPGTVKNQFLRLRAVLDMAVDDRVLSSNPCRTKTVEKALVAYAPQEVEVPTDAMVDSAIARAVELGDSEMAVAIELDRCTGLRPGELFAVTADSFPFGKVPLVRVAHQLNNGRKKDDPNIFATVKYPASEREIPLAERAWLAIAPLLAAARARPRHGGLVFLAERGGVMWDTAYEKRLSIVTEGAFTFKSLRHQFISRMLEVADLKTVQAIAGHKKAGMEELRNVVTVDVYGHRLTGNAATLALIERALQVPIGSHNPDAELFAQARELLG